MEKTIAVLAGDGIGPEVMAQALRVLKHVTERNGQTFRTVEALIGGAAFEVHGKHFPEETREICERSDAILFGSVGGPVAELHLEKWKDCEVNALLGIRKTFRFNANFRPVKVFPELMHICPLREEVVNRGVDILFIRELNGDLYFGEKKRFERDGMRVATDLAEYSEEQVRSVAHTAFQAARKRRNKVTSVDKANVLHTSKLWREVVREVAKEYPDVVLEDMLVDNCAMQIIRNPSQFDVILTTNMFGDILSDAGAVLPGSLGLLASASLNADGFGLYEPPGGSAQDIAGKGVANPIAQILSVAMMLRFSFSLIEEAERIEQAVGKALLGGARTGDIAAPGDPVIGTVEMTDSILSHL
ncbi:MAG: 3-isopropylmalate dehydrogenase [Bdellovibrionales bacterium]|nr:3-isopropylmalate dehydrogenase [Bdellovibrionales bacterium]